MCYDCGIGGKIMYCNQKYSGAVKGFLLGSLLMFSLMFVGKSLYEYQSPKNTVSFDEAVARIKSDGIKEIRIKNETAEFLKDEQLAYSTVAGSDALKEVLFQQVRSNGLTITFEPQSSNPLGYLIQILFWLFLISPPVIVVLLLIIIKKMDARGGVK
jgi:ATP-dependent Zn protease